jgi:hypothetical protein
VGRRHLAFVLLLCGTIDACSGDEGTTDGGVDATSDVVTDAGVEAAKDATPDAGSDVIVPTCEGGTACGKPSDCPATPTCVTRTCTDSCCGTAPAAAGVQCTEDGGQVCDGTGKCVGCNSPSNCPQSTTVCQVPGCENTVCTMTPAPVGTFCNNDGGKVCDGTGLCVGCNQPSDCPTQTTVCNTSMCSQNTCGTVPAPNGTPCADNGGIVCDGAGTCVQCNTTSDCLAINDAGTLVCVNNHCN